jgi:hypothetical protein
MKSIHSITKKEVSGQIMNTLYLKIEVKMSDLYRKLDKFKGVTQGANNAILSIEELAIS